MESNLWIKALKAYNKGSKEWCVPKKGSLGYQAVKKMMETPSSLANIEVKKYERKKRPLKQYK